jgi:Tol biopolymer transport system component
MKRCPECRRDYYDDSLLYCLDDGTALVDGPGGEPTAILSERSIQTPAGDTSTKLFDSENRTMQQPDPTTQATRRKPSWVALIVVIAVIVLGAGGYLIYRSIGPKKTNISFAAAKITRLTTSGKALEAAISPDGKWVVYVQKDGGQQSLWMRQTATTSAIQIVPSADVQIGRETFSPDGTYVYYYVTDANNPSGVLYQASTIGGPPRRILSNIGSPVTFSPDGKSIAFVRNDEVATAEDQLIVANADGTGERKLAARKGATWFGYPTGCSWSPDGKLIACSGGRYNNGSETLLIMVDAETGEQQEFQSIAFSDLGRVSWVTDGSGLVVSAADRASFFNQIWFIAYPSGEAHKITNDLMEYAGTSLTADSGTVVSVQDDDTANIWTAPIGDMTHPKQITFAKFEGDVNTSGGLAWAADGRIVYISMASGNADVWIMKGDGSDQKQLTSDPGVDKDPVLTPDGRYIVFSSDRGGLPGIWRMDLDGGNLKQLTDRDDHKPQISSDSKWIVFDSWRSQKRALWKISVDGGDDPVQITDKFTSSCAVSPDGRSIACYYRADEHPGTPWRIMILPFEGGQPTKTFDASVENDFPLEAGLGWTPDGRAIVYVSSSGGIPNLSSQPIDGGAAKKLTDFKENGVWRFAWSRDNKQIALSRGSSTGDVVSIKDFK